MAPVPGTTPNIFMFPQLNIWVLISNYLLHIQNEC